MIEEILQTPVTAAILVATSVVSVAALYNKRLKSIFLLHPYSVGKGERWHTLFTGSLVHASWLHLLFNMLIVFVFASRLEKEFVLRSEWGHLQLGFLYIISCTCSNAMAVVKYKNDFWYNSLGASGGALAIFCSYLLLTPFNNLLTLPVVGQVPNIYLLIVLLIGCAYSAKWRKAQKIDHYGHLVGGITGAIITIAIYPAALLNVLNYFTNSWVA